MAATNALPVEDYRDPFLVVADTETGDVMPASRGKVACQGCRYKRAAIAHFVRQPPVWPCWLGAMPRADGRCAKFEGG